MATVARVRSLARRKVGVGSISWTPGSWASEMRAEDWAVIVRTGPKGDSYWERTGKPSFSSAGTVEERASGKIRTFRGETSNFDPSDSVRAVSRRGPLSL